MRCKEIPNALCKTHFQKCFVKIQDAFPVRVLCGQSTFQFFENQKLPNFCNFNKPKSMIFHLQLGSPVFYYLGFDAVWLPKCQQIVLLLESEIIEIQINFLLFDFQESTGCVCYAAKQHFNFSEIKKTAANFSIFNFSVSMKISRASWVLFTCTCTFHYSVLQAARVVRKVGVVNAMQRLRGGA